MDAEGDAVDVDVDACGENVRAAGLSRNLDSTSG